MKVTVQYHDQESFLLEEVVRQAKDNYGAAAQVTVQPESDAPIDVLYFAIQRLITGDQLSLLYDSKEEYRQKIAQLRDEMIWKMKDVLDEVIMDNEARLH